MGTPSNGTEQTSIKRNFSNALGNICHTETTGRTASPNQAMRPFDDWES
jgi:hypothetical protein